MRTEHLEPRDATKRGNGLPFALVRTVSGVTLGRTPVSLDWEELIEARFFGESEEIRLFSRQGRWQARLVEEADDRPLRDECALENPRRFGESLTICRYLDFDEDGQAYIARTRLAGWKEGTRRAK